MKKKYGTLFKGIKMIKYQYLTFFLLAIVTPTFSALVDVMPVSGETLIILTPIILFSFIGLVRFVAHFLEYPHFRKELLITSLFVLCAIILCAMVVTVIAFLYDISLLFRAFVINGGFAIIIGFPIGLVYLFKKKDKLARIYTLYVLGITIIFIIAVLNIDFFVCFMVAFLIVVACLLITFLSGALGLISLIWLIKLLIKKIK